MEKLGFVVVAFLLVVHVRKTYSALECTISADCGDAEGRTICFNSRCRKDIPCTKDNDCFFYGARDIASGGYHPLCFQTDNVDTNDGYGICMIEEFVMTVVYKPGIRRLPGLDVNDVLQSNVAKCKNN